MEGSGDGVDWGQQAQELRETTPFSSSQGGLLGTLYREAFNCCLHAPDDGELTTPRRHTVPSLSTSDSQKAPR